MTTLTGKEVFQQLMAEIDNTDPETLPPPDKREKNETQLGTVTDPWLRKVFCLGNFLRREAKRLQVDLEAIGEEPKKSPLFGEYKQKHDALMEMFWYGARAQINIWGGGIGIRKYWELVKIEDSDNNLLTLIKRNLSEE